jgi:hypothetical protein
MTDKAKPATDQAHFSPALLGFYGCCAAIAAGAGMFFFAWFVLTKEGFGALPTGMKVVGGILMAGGIPGAFFCLGKARRPEA